MPSGIKLSILLSAYNAEPFIAEAIDSLIAQTFQDFELIIADDGSSDRTRSIIDQYQKHPQIVISHNEKNMGKVATINRLFSQSQGEFVTVHDADDVSLPERFEIQLRKLQHNESLVMCGTWFDYVDTSKKLIFRCESISNYEEIRERIMHESVFHGPTVVLRRCAMEKAGEFFRPFFDGFNEDADLNMRLSEQGECYNIPQSLYKYRVVSGSLSKDLDARKMVLYRVVVFLALQRQETGSDMLERGQEDVVQEYLDEQIAAFTSNNRTFHQEIVWKLLYFGLVNDAIRKAVLGILRQPFIFSNYKLLIYCLGRKLKGS